jgi:hypothetical protein
MKPKNVLKILNKNSYSNLIFMNFPHDAAPRQTPPTFPSIYPASGFDEIKGRFIKSYNGDNEFSHALQVFKLPLNYFKVVMDYLPTIASKQEPK